MTICYHMSPEGIPFAHDVWQTAPNRVHVVSLRDNGAGGGDCLSGTLDSRDRPSATVEFTAVINGQTKVARVTVAVQ